jgi:hypothetical protein
VRVYLPNQVKIIVIYECSACLFFLSHVRNNLNPLAGHPLLNNAERKWCAFDIVCK